MQMFMSKATNDQYSEQNFLHQGLKTVLFMLFIPGIYLIGKLILMII